MRADDNFDAGTAPPEHGLPRGRTVSRVTACSTEAASDALARVLESRAFAKTARLSGFLRYVCDTTIAGDATRLTEHHIGRQVFGRSEQYNPAEDTIVRTTARLLRQRLADYYDTEGSADPCRIDIPRGGYVPVFVQRPELSDPVADRLQTQTQAAEMSMGGLPARLPLEPQAPVRPAARRRGEHRRWPEFAWSFADLSWARAGNRSAWLVAVVAIGAAVSVCAHAFAPQSPSKALWSALLTEERDTLLVPADSNLVLYQLGALRQIGLEDYIAKRFGPESATPDMKSFRNRQTSVSSVALGIELGKRSAAASERLHMRYARDLQWSDLRRSNLILVGVRQANPWVELFRNRFNFHIDWDIPTEKFLVRNDLPLPGERHEYEFSKNDPGKRGYAYIAYTRGLNGQGHVLLVEGTTAAGAEAAEDFLLDRHRMDAVLRRAVSPTGVVGDFEVLLECVLQAGGSTDVRVVAQRTGGSRS